MARRKAGEGNEDKGNGRTQEASSGAGREMNIGNGSAKGRKKSRLKDEKTSRSYVKTNRSKVQTAETNLYQGLS
jgi:hypothetical protein